MEPTCHADRWRSATQLTRGPCQSSTPGRRRAHSPMCYGSLQIPSKPRQILTNPARSCQIPEPTAGERGGATRGTAMRNETDPIPPTPGARCRGTACRARLPGLHHGTPRTKNETNPITVAAEPIGATRERGETKRTQFRRALRNHARAAGRPTGRSACRYLGARAFKMPDPV